MPPAKAFSNWKAITRRIEELERDEQDRLRLLDLWTFQKSEIDGSQAAAGRRRAAGDGEACPGQCREDLQRGDECFRSSLRRPGFDFGFVAGGAEASRRAGALRAEVPGSAGSARDSAHQRGGRRCKLCATTPEASRLRPSIWRRWKTGWRRSIGLKRKYGPTLEDVIAVRRRSQPQAVRDGEQGRDAARLARAAGAGRRRSICKRRARFPKSVTKPRKSWRSWLKPRSTIWP